MVDKTLDEMTDEEIDALSFEQRRKLAQAAGVKAINAPAPKEMEIDLGILEPEGNNSEEPIPIISVQPDKYLDYAVDDLAERMEVDRSAKSNKARFRAQRAHMMRKLKREFDLYNPFTPELAAEKCKISLMDVRAYLQFECTLPGSLIEKTEDGKFIIISAFL
jgi:hypothetical protein